MVQQWFYGQEGNKLGPCTAQQLRELASAGKIVLTDTIWKEGIDLGVLATRVKNLFPLPAILPLSRDVAAPVNQPAAHESTGIDARPAESIPSLSSGHAAEVAGTMEGSAPVKTPTPAYQPSGEKKQVKKGRAIALKGAKITGQDGTTVQFRKICTTCGHEDPSRTTLPIRTGMTRIPFYCPKCRKSREVEIQGLS
jgi:hypothetical protein